MLSSFSWAPCTAILLRSVFSLHYDCEGDEWKIEGRMGTEEGRRTRECNQPLTGKEIAVGEIRRGDERKGDFKVIFSVEFTVVRANFGRAG